jgi:hypothetical protein
MTKSKKQQAGMENSSEITWGEIKRRVAKEADEVAQAIRSETLKFCQYVAEAFCIAALYARASRVSPEKRNIDSGQFLSAYLRLVENLKRADKLLQTSPKLLDKWPQAPNTMFGSDAGSSALAVAYKFSQRVKNAVTIARAFALGCGHGEDFFDGIVPSDERVRDWLDAAVKELQTKVLPQVADWPIWQMNRDVDSLGYQLLAEQKKENEQITSSREKTRIFEPQIVRPMYPFRNPVGARGLCLALTPEAANIPQYFLDKDDIAILKSAVPEVFVRNSDGRTTMDCAQLEEILISEYNIRPADTKDLSWRLILSMLKRVQRKKGSSREKTTQNIEGEQTETAEQKQTQKKGGQCKVKEPSKEARLAYQSWYGTGKTQEDVAKIMTDKLKRPVNQGQVSRWVTRYKKWREAEGIPVDDTKPNIIVNSDILDVGARTDGKTTGDPRHKKNADYKH